MILIPILNGKQPYEQLLKTTFLVYERRAISSSLSPNKKTQGIINTTQNS